MFYESSQINSYLTCPKCNERFDEPKILPCGLSVCLQCCKSFELIPSDNTKFKCICNQSHTQSEFPTSIALLNLLKLKPNQIHRSDAVDSLTNSLNEIQSRLDSFKRTTSNSVDKVKEYCLSLKQDVYLSTELALQQINELSDEFIQIINKYELDCLESLEKNDKHLVEVNHLINDIQIFHDEWCEYLKQFQISDQDVTKANDSSLKLIQILDEEYIKLETMIFNYNMLKFEPNVSKLEASHLGQFTSAKFLLNSNILTNKQCKELMQLCGFSTSQRWRLLYRASEMGFSAESFHSKCDRKANTLIIIKSYNLNVFGGYTQQDWSNCDEGYKADPNAFIFSLINKDNNPILIKCSDSQHAILARNGYGPVFGNGII